MDSTLLYIAIGGLVLVIVGVAVAVPMLSKKRGSASASPGEDKQARRPSKEAPASPTGGPMAIYFGSQTGTAECFAKTIQKEAKKKGRWWRRVVGNVMCQWAYGAYGLPQALPRWCMTWRASTQNS